MSQETLGKISGALLIVIAAEVALILNFVRVVLAA